MEPNGWADSHYGWGRRLRLGLLARRELGVSLQELAGRPLARPRRLALALVPRLAPLGERLVQWVIVLQ